MIFALYKKILAALNWVAAPLFSLKDGVYLVFAALSLTCAVTIPYLLKQKLLSCTQPYSDFIPGLITFEDYCKNGEFHLFLLGFIIFFVAFYALSFTADRLLPVLHKKERRGTSLQRYLSFVLTLLVFWAVRRVYGTPPDVIEIGILVFLFGYLTVEWMVSKDLQSSLDRIKVVAVSVVLYFFAGCALLMGAYYLFDSKLSTQLPLFIASLGFIPLLLPSGMIQEGRLIKLISGIPQVLLPLLLFRLVRMDFLEGVEVVPSKMNQYGEAVTFGFVLFLVLIAIARLFDKKARSTRLDSLVSPWALFSIGAYFHFHFPALSALSTDDFHLGEMILPWQQIATLGQAQYSGFVSIHGMWGLLLGAVDQYFYAGNIQTFLPAESMLRSLICGGIVALVARNLGTIWAFIVLPVALPHTDRLYFVVLGFLILASETLLATPLYWLLSYVALACAAILLIPGSGAAFSLSLLPCALALALAAVLPKFPKVDRRGVIFTVLLGVAIAALSSPLIGVIQFVKENGSTNTTAYSTLIFEHVLQVVPGIPHQFNDPLYNRLAWEVIRIGGWMLGVVTLFLLWIRTRTSPWQRLTPASLLSISLILFLFLLFPYAMGRVDPPFSLSRVGALSFATLGIFIPIAYAATYKQIGSSPLPLFVIAISMGIPFARFHPLLSDLLNRPTLQLAVPPGFISADPAYARFPGLGDSIIPQDKAPAFVALDDELKRLLKPGETYFDFTNRSATYYILNYRVPSPYSATYLAVNEPIQRRVIERLEKELPPIALVYPDIRFDKASPSLRSYRVFRWFIDKGYKMVPVRTNWYLIRPDRLAEHPELRPLSNDDFAKLMATPDLEGIPAAWGKSRSQLESRLQPSVQLETSTVDGAMVGKGGWWKLKNRTVIFHLKPNEILSGANNDYLILKLERMGDARPRKFTGALSWRGKDEAFDPARQIKFRAPPGDLIIPAANDPRWLLNENIEEVTLEITGDDIGSWLKVSEARGMKLVR